MMGTRCRIRRHRTVFQSRFRDTGTSYHRTNTLTRRDRCWRLPSGSIRCRPLRTTRSAVRSTSSGRRSNMRCCTRRKCRNPRRIPRRKLSERSTPGNHRRLVRTFPVRLRSIECSPRRSKCCCNLSRRRSLRSPTCLFRYSRSRRFRSNLSQPNLSPPSLSCRCRTRWPRRRTVPSPHRGNVARPEDTHRPTRTATAWLPPRGYEASRLANRARRVSRVKPRRILGRQWHLNRDVRRRRASRTAAVSFSDGTLTLGAQIALLRLCGCRIHHPPTRTSCGAPRARAGMLARRSGLWRRSYRAGRGRGRNVG